MSIRKRTWYWLLAMIILMLLYFAVFLYAEVFVDMKYGVIDRLIMTDKTGIGTEVRNSVTGYANSFSFFILIQFMVIFYLWSRIDRK
jgi:hypothetical protein